jgi:hypothetical protein
MMLLVTCKMCITGQSFEAIAHRISYQYKEQMPMTISTSAAIFMAVSLSENYWEQLSN